MPINTMEQCNACGQPTSCLINHQINLHELHYAFVVNGKTIRLNREGTTTPLTCPINGCLFRRGKANGVMAHIAREHSPAEIKALGHQPVMRNTHSFAPMRQSHIPTLDHEHPSHGSPTDNVTSTEDDSFTQTTDTSHDDSTSSEDSSLWGGKQAGATAIEGTHSDL
ncbi:hypothetical protein CYLTODRAFT_460490 [Cylindrobasidium torrendii FP15055 ss-10]|uniref:Uncharacterized protein n=1 Tax=Cylindrobasidium torrendii FP15055 ss-10 TaxID=1314674 RepID=A0A0D7ATW4_9AGAR|nr:hypothetical protein CYLTODRAFT_460490 [Cylindrobasidium torrendii FP15055 ss-10]